MAATSTSCRWWRARARKDFFDLDITLEVHDLRHLNDIMASLRGKPAVSDVSRKTG